VEGQWARNVSGLRVGTDYAAQTVVGEVFGEHQRFILSNLPFHSQKSI